MNTRRYPRTMQQAFGPYTDNTLHPMRDRNRSRADIALYIVAVLAVVVIGVTL